MGINLRLREAYADRHVNRGHWGMGTVGWFAKTSGGDAFIHYLAAARIMEPTDLALQTPGTLVAYAISTCFLCIPIVAVQDGGSFAHSLSGLVGLATSRLRRK